MHAVIYNKMVHNITNVYITLF